MQVGVIGWDGWDGNVQMLGSLCGALPWEGMGMDGMSFPPCSSKQLSDQPFFYSLALHVLALSH